VNAHFNAANFECSDTLPRLQIRILNTMNFTKLFSFVPVFSAAALLATPSTGFSDHKVTVYRDRDHDGHYVKKTYDSHNHHYPGRPYYYGAYPYSGYGYGYAAPYYRPSVSVNIRRSYSPGYSDDLATDVQRELRRRGYYRGSIDGDVGPGTRNAISNYQSDRGLPVTGRIDRNLLRALGIG
jgi:hypothetical protein